MLTNLRKIAGLFVMIALVLPVFEEGITDVAGRTAAAAGAGAPALKVVAGDRQSYALDTDGKLYGWGLYDDFVFSSGLTSPNRLEFLDGKAIADIATNRSSVIVLLEDGTVWVHEGFWSSDEMFNQVPGLKNIRAIATDIYSAAVDDRGFVYTWYEYPTSPAFELRVSPTALPGAAELHAGYAVTEEGKAYYLGLSGVEEFTPLGDLTGITKIVKADNSYYALMADGTVWGWGLNELDGVKLWEESSWTPFRIEGLNDIRDMASSDRHFIALKKDGTVWAWGKNDQFQFGNGLQTDSGTPVQVKNLKGIASISTGGGAEHSFAIDQEGNVWSWGRNGSGETGVNEKAPYIKSPKKLFFARVHNGEEKFNVASVGPSNDIVNSYAAGGNGLVLAATDKLLLRSQNHGQTWSKHPLPVQTKYTRMQYISSNQTFYLSNYNSFEPVTYTSKDGLKWTEFTITGADNAPLRMLTIQWIQGQYVMTATDKKIMDVRKIYILTSADGAAWKHVSTIEDSGVQIVWNGKRYVGLAGGYLYAGRPATNNQIRVDQKNGLSGELIVYTSDDLKSWKQQSGSIKSHLKYEGIPHNGKPFKMYGGDLHDIKPNGTIVLTDSYGNVLESADGITFKAVRKDPLFHMAARSETMWNGSHYLIYLGVYTDNAYVLTSKDKVKWTKKAITGIPGAIMVAKSGSKFVAFSYNGTIATSQDGLTWKVVVAEKPDYRIYDTLKARDKYVAGGSQATRVAGRWTLVPAILTSKDGVSWTSVLPPETNNDRDRQIRSLATNGKGYVAVGQRMSYTSKDGSKWTLHKQKPELDLYQVIWSGKSYVAFGRTSNASGLLVTSDVYTSADGVNWKKTYATKGHITKLAVSSGGTVVAVGSKDRKAMALASANLANWKETLFTLGKDNEYWSAVSGEAEYSFVNVQWAKDRFLVMSDQIYSSKDGISWSVVASDYGLYLKDSPSFFGNGQVFWTGKEYRYYVGGRVGVSTDLKAWTFYDLDLGGDLYQLIWTGSGMLGVVGDGSGGGGTMIRITDRQA